MQHRNSTGRLRRKDWQLGEADDRPAHCDNAAWLVYCISWGDGHVVHETSYNGKAEAGGQAGDLDTLLQLWRLNGATGCQGKKIVARGEGLWRESFQSFEGVTDGYAGGQPGIGLSAVKDPDFQNLVVILELNDDRGWRFGGDVHANGT